MKKLKRGGKREGSGPKPRRGETKRPLTIKITPTLRAYLDSRDASCADFIEDSIRRTAAFKDWIKKSKLQKKR